MSIETLTIQEKSDLYDSTKKRLKEFISLPNDPGIPYAAQLKLREISEHTNTQVDIENYKKSKESKYRANALTTPLVMSQAFLMRAPEAKDIPEEIKAELLNRIKIVAERIRAKSSFQPITEESVDEVVDIVENILAFLN